MASRPSRIWSSRRPTSRSELGAGQGRARRPGSIASQLLRPNAVDPDLLEERARAQLDYMPSARSDPDAQARADGRVSLRDAPAEQLRQSRHDFRFIRQSICAGGRNAGRSRASAVAPICAIGWCRQRVYGSPEDDHGRRQEEAQQRPPPDAAGQDRAAEDRRIQQGAGAQGLSRHAADPPLRGEGGADVRHGPDRRLLPPLHRPGSRGGRHADDAQAGRRGHHRLPRPRPHARLRHGSRRASWRS